MFTGIIETLGTVAQAEKVNGDLRLEIHSSGFDWSTIQLGDSIATNGVCLTAVQLSSSGFIADVSVETLELTTLAAIKAGDTVNLERALTPETRLGGHLVSGHVDGIGDVVERHNDARSVRFRLRAPEELAKYIAHKGSITVDGTSLTVNKVDGALFEMNIVPHTLEKTIIGRYQVGTRVNLEVDLIARYLERLLLGDKAAVSSGSTKLTESFLADNGYLK